MEDTGIYDGIRIGEAGHNDNIVLFQVEPVLWSAMLCTFVSGSVDSEFNMFTSISTEKDERALPRYSCSCLLVH